MNKNINIHFLGGAGVVTGSKFLLETSEKNILIDCGMFQGLKELRDLNWNNIPFDVQTIDVVLLTHGHLDHVGYLPRLVKQGFRGEIIGTAPTLAIAEIILKDSAKIHAEHTEKANKEKYSKHHPALPFFTEEDVEKTITLFNVEMIDKWVRLSKNISYRFQYNGHIIGATFVELDINSKRFVFSGDIGRPNDYLLEDPKKPEWADFLFLESTYGNKLHPKENIENTLTELVNEVILKKGNLIIPSFAVERLQTLMFILWRLYQKNKIPNIPIFIDSPMGNNVLEVFNRFPKWHKLSTQDYNAMCYHINIIQSYRETWETIDDKRSKIIIAGSGMVTGGRVLTYLQQIIDNPTTTVLLVGYQAEGTRGRQLQEGAHEIRFFGKYYPVKANIRTIESLSAHADQNEIIDWMKLIKNIPETVYLTHGEPSALDALRLKIKHVYKWNCTIPKLLQIDKVMI
ncbi:MBL fold metallo-hydrolase RNA specificity domain-containing protein [Seonamhaeicola aphaedonensis]|uniref:Metallo-beta-lactamase family protein n=1 Tax=Seonamhaeicola aphaedonensis TaxID=1461338 RepID=A0A3D9HIS5_9FLAO|nr:MBL fold metallo-hydrolase [Seonamhaeicola aphaedonensis]RED49363.1 metallo-beta-lactamase family protein [Seonamhaeicola aphaedonensis]